MRAAVTFFLFLCFHLVAGTATANATICSPQVPSASKQQHIKKAPGCQTSAKTYQINKGVNKEIETDYFVFVEDEDDKENSNKKNVPAPRQFDALSYANNIRQLTNRHLRFLSSDKRQYFTSSRKFIEQRVLRI